MSHFFYAIIENFLGISAGSSINGARKKETPSRRSLISTSATTLEQNAREGTRKKKKERMFCAGVEPATFCVLSRCDNRYTNRTPLSSTYFWLYKLLQINDGYYCVEAPDWLDASESTLSLSFVVDWIFLIDFSFFFSDFFSRRRRTVRMIQRRRIKQTLPRKIQIMRTCPEILCWDEVSFVTVRFDALWYNSNTLSIPHINYKSIRISWILIFVGLEREKNEDNIRWCKERERENFALRLIWFQWKKF